MTGSGKSENAKRIIHFLTSEGDEGVVKKINAAETILDAFENAKTIGNHHASRFVNMSFLTS
jgi:myosin heavy subunit